MPDINERVVKVEVQLKDLDRRVNDVEDASRINHEMLNEFKIMNANVTSQLNDVSEKISKVDTKVDKVDTKFDKLETKVNEIEQKPAKFSLKLLLAFGGMVCTGIVGYILALIGLGG